MAVSKIAKTSGIYSLDVDVYGTVIDQPESGWCYKILVVDSLPAGAIAFLAIWKTGFNNSVSVFMRGDNKLCFMCPTQKTIANRYVTIFYTI